MGNILKSTDVKVFPFGTSRNVDKFSRVLNEQNIVRILTNIVDKDSFLVSRDLNDTYEDDSTTKTRIEFVLKGYYFSIGLDLNPDSSSYVGSNNVYAYIDLADVDSNNPHLYGSDDIDTGTFTGLLISTETTGTYGTKTYKYCLQLLEYSEESESHQLCSSSMIKFDNKSYETPEIDYTQITFENVNLSQADFTGANLANADFKDADLANADFTGVKMTDANMPYNIETDIQVIYCGNSKEVMHDVVLKETD